jgi:putative heme-binding domain-containing protein
LSGERNELLASIGGRQQQRARFGEIASLQVGTFAGAVHFQWRQALALPAMIGYLGGKLGPDLTKIGQIRTERDLLESILYPSTSFVRSYEPMVIATKSGEDYSGVLRKDAPDEVILATGPEAEVRIARNDLVEMRPGTISIMPQGLDEQLTPQELADLVAFLKATNW